jgi:hypothetical protein
VIKWCAAFALGEIAKYNPDTRKQLLPFFEGLIKSEENSGVIKVYLNAMHVIKTNSKIEGSTQTK